jgi:hypothetical protein
MYQPNKLGRYYLNKRITLVLDASPNGQRTNSMRGLLCSGFLSDVKASKRTEYTSTESANRCCASTSTSKPEKKAHNCDLAGHTINRGRAGSPD